MKHATNWIVWNVLKGSEQCALKTDISIKANPFQYDVRLWNVKGFNGFFATLKNLLMRNEIRFGIHPEIHLNFEEQISIESKCHKAWKLLEPFFHDDSKCYGCKREFSCADLSASYTKKKIRQILSKFPKKKMKFKYVLRWSKGDQTEFG